MVGKKIIEFFIQKPIDYSELIEVVQMEDFDQYSISCHIDLQTSLKSELDFKDSLEYNERDTFELILQVGDLDSRIITSNNFDFDTFKANVNSDIEFRDVEQKTRVTYTLFKSEFDKKQSLYSPQHFHEYLNKLSLAQVLSTFEKNKNEDGNLCFEYFEDEKYPKLNSNFISFMEKGDSFTNNDRDTDSILKKRNQLCHFANSANYNFLPEDFHFGENLNGHNDLRTLFFKLKVVFSIISIFDITRIEDNQIHASLKGFKSFSKTWDFSQISIQSSEEWFKIYDWIYSSGETIDKIGLTRNIISLHIDDVQPALFNGEPYYSIISGFEIYIKENVKQYIDLKNKLSDNIIALSNKANSIVDAFASNFKKSILTFVTLFASIVISKILATDSGDFGISREASIISYVFLLVVLIFLIFSWWELKTEKERFEVNYKNLKNRYSDLLVEEDLKRILNSDQDHISDLAYIEEKRNAYSIIWILLVIIFTTTVVALSH